MKTEKLIQCFVCLDGWLHSLWAEWLLVLSITYGSSALIFKTSESKMGLSHVESPSWASKTENPIKSYQWPANQYHKTQTLRFHPQMGISFHMSLEWSHHLRWVINENFSPKIPFIFELHSVAFLSFLKYLFSFI